MTISMDSDGNVVIDRSYNTTGINTINTNMMIAHNQMKVFDSTQIIALLSALNSQYPGLVNFEVFMDEWPEVLGEVEL